MHSTHNKGKSFINERFISTWKEKIYKKITANDSKCYLGYLNKLVNEYNNTCQLPIGKNPIDADYSAFTEEIEKNPKVPKFKVDDKVC